MPLPMITTFTSRKRRGAASLAVLALLGLLRLERIGTGPRTPRAEQAMRECSARVPGAHCARLPQPREKGLRAAAGWDRVLPPTHPPSRKPATLSIWQPPGSQLASSRVGVHFSHDPLLSWCMKVTSGLSRWMA